MPSINSGDNMDLGGPERRKGEISPRVFLRRTIAMAVLLPVMVLGVLLFLYNTEAKLAERNTPLLLASLEVQIQLSEFHLWLEELLQGDMSIPEEEVWKFFDKAERFSHAILDGGVVPEGAILPLKNPELRTTAGRFDRLIDELRDVTEDRLANSETSMIGSKTDKRFDAIFFRVLANAKEVERAIKADIDVQSEQLRSLAILLAIGVVVIAILAGAAFLRFGRQLEHAYRNLAQAQGLAHVGSWDWDIARDEVTWSDETYRIFGIENTKADFSLNPEMIEGMIVPEDRPLQRKAIEDTFSGKRKGYRVDFRALRPDGDTRCVEVYGEATYDADGNPIRLTGSIQDITERKRTEAALQESEERFHDFASAASDWLWETDTEGRIFWESECFREEAGRTFAEIKGMTREEIAGDLMTEKEWLPYRQALQEHKDINDFEYRYPGLDGKIHYALINGKAMLDESGAYLGHRGAASGITERKKMEDILRNIAEGVSGAVGKTFFDRLVGFLAKALEVDYAFIGRLAQGGESVWTVSLHAKGKITDNIEYRLEGTPSENIIDRGLAIFEDGAAEHFPEDQLLRDDNIESYVGAPLFDSSGQPLGILVVMSEAPLKLPAMVRSLMRIFAVRAATELEREMALEKLELSREEAEAANNAKSEFLAHMSHDLRTPLNAIMGFSQMMTQRTFGSLGDPRYEGYARDINDSGDLLLSLIDDILDISKIEAGKYELAEEILNIPLSIKASVKMLNKQAEEKKIRLVNTCKSDLPRLRCDEKAVTQILNNLLSNAIKFTPDQGEVTVNAWKSKDNRFKIKISDTGIGMSKEDISKALNPFEQVNSRQPRKHKGTGLGLHLCCRLIDLHDGEMTFESEIDNGTTVTVSFPPERIVMDV